MPGIAPRQRVGKTFLRQVGRARRGREFPPAASPRSPPPRPRPAKTPWSRGTSPRSRRACARPVSPASPASRRMLPRPVRPVDVARMVLRIRQVQRIAGGGDHADDALADPQAGSARRRRYSAPRSPPVPAPRRRAPHRSRWRRISAPAPPGRQYPAGSRPRRQCRPQPRKKLPCIAEFRFAFPALWRRC